MVRSVPKLSLVALLTLSGAWLINGTAQAQAKAQGSEQAFDFATYWFTGAANIPLRAQADATTPLQKMGFISAGPTDWSFEDSDGHVRLFLSIEDKAAVVTYVPTSKKPLASPILSTLSQMAQSIDIDGADRLLYHMKTRTEGSWAASLNDKVFLRMSDGAWLWTEREISWKHAP